MTILNVIIARRLQLAKQNRRRLKLRPQATTQKMSTVSSPDRKSEMAYVIKSFTEKKLTVLMIAICIIYIIGNIPQTVVMIFQSDATKNEYGFQVWIQLLFDSRYFSITFSDVPRYCQLFRSPQSLSQFLCVLYGIERIFARLSR